MLGLLPNSISNKGHIDAIFESLLTNYDTFILSIELHANSYTIDDLESLLLAQKARIKKKNKEYNFIQARMANVAISQISQQQK